MSSMFGAGLIEIPPVSKQTPLPMNATGASPRSSAIPTHHHDAALARRTLTDAEKSVHAEFFHRLDVKNFDGDAKLFQCPCAACEFFRVKDIGRFVDQVSGQHDAVGNRHARGIGFAHGGNIADRDGHVPNSRRLFVFLALGLVAIECVCAQAGPLRQIRRLLRPHRAARQFGEDTGVGGRIRQPADRKASEPEKVLWRELSDLSYANHDQAGRLEPGRHNKIQG